MDNKQIAAVFSLLARVMEINGENSFRIKTYSNAAFQIERLTEQLSNLDAAGVSAIKGIGDSTGKKIAEILSTGKLAQLEKLISTMPAGVLEMMQVKGMGTKKINVIWKEMEIESIGELLYACNENRLARYKGFGDKTEQNIKAAIEFYLSKQGFFLYKEAIPFAETILRLLNEAFPKNKIYTTGDFRRQMETLEEIAFVTDISKNDVKTVFENLVGIHFSVEENSFLKYRMESGPMIKLHCCSREQLAATLFLTTGSIAFTNFFEVQNANFDLFNNSIHEEKNIFENAGLAFIPPFLREESSILELAAKNKIAAPISVADIKGIIHSHSTWSDGKQTTRQMAEAAIKAGFEYLAITDHSGSAVYADGLKIDQVAQQHTEIDALNKDLAPFKILKGIESDILNDGSLDYPAAVLATFDLVIASVHSGLKMTEEKATARLLRAIENPFTTILGHMTGRLLLSRSGYPVDHKKIIEACAANGVVIELNANARRLDMDWRWLTYALEKGVLISINPDAHSTAAFTDVAYGVFAAQKGMLSAEKNLSSFSLAQLTAHLEKRKMGVPAF